MTNFRLTNTNKGNGNSLRATQLSKSCAACFIMNDHAIPTLKAFRCSWACSLLSATERGLEGEKMKRDPDRVQNDQ